MCHRLIQLQKDMSFLHDFFKDFIFLFMRDTHTHTHREAETQAEGEAGFMQGAQCGTRSWDSGIMPWAKGRHQIAEPLRHSQN